MNIEINIADLDNPFEREKLEMLPNTFIVELLVRHLKREIKAIEYIEENMNMYDNIENERQDLLDILKGSEKE